MYRLTCDCGETLTVTARQAGQRLPCPSCEQGYEVPSLREIRELQASTPTPSVPSASGWTRTRGSLFSIGLLLSVIGWTVTGYFAWQRSGINTDPLRLEDLQFARSPDQLSPSQSWEAWETAFRDVELDVRQTPRHQINRQRSQELLAYELVAGLFGAMGLGAIFASIIARGR